MEEINWEEKKKENLEILDSIDLPKPKIGEEVRDYLDRIDIFLKDVELPEDYGDDFLAWLDLSTFGEYLAKRFGMRCDEDVIITWTLY